MREVTAEELRDSIGDGSIFVVDVLSREAYKRLHIAGSISIPWYELQGGAWRKLQRDKSVVVYCSGPTCQASKEAARFLVSKGFDAAVYEGGIQEWAELGYPSDGNISREQFLEEKRRYLAVIKRPSPEKSPNDK